MRESEVGGFAFERLDVYQRAIEFLVVVARIISELPGGNGSLTDQLRRAALSRRPDAEQDVRVNSVVVHVHDYVHGHVQNGICTLFIFVGDEETGRSWDPVFKPY